MLLNNARLSTLPWKPGWQKCLIWTSIATKNRYCVTLEQKVIDIYGDIDTGFPFLWLYNKWSNTSCSVIITIFRPSFWYLVDEAACLYQWLTSRYTCIYIGICSLPSIKHCPHHYVGSYQALSLSTVLCKFFWPNISWYKWKSLITAFFWDDAPMESCPPFWPFWTYLGILQTYLLTRLGGWFSKFRRFLYMTYLLILKL